MTALSIPQPTEVDLSATLELVREHRRASLIDLVPFDDRKRHQPGGCGSALTPEGHARKLLVYVSLYELKRRGLVEFVTVDGVQHWQVVL